MAMTFDQLYNQYFRCAVAFVASRWMVGDYNRAEDLVQEVMLKIHDKMVSGGVVFEIPSKAKQYLYQEAKWTALHWCRMDRPADFREKNREWYRKRQAAKGKKVKHHKKKKFWLAEETLTPHLDIFECRHHQTPELAGTRLLRAAIEELPPQQRRTITLFLDGLPANEIAEKIGSGESAVRGNMMRARIALRRLLDPDQCFQLI